MILCCDSHMHKNQIQYVNKKKAAASLFDPAGVTPLQNRMIKEFLWRVGLLEYAVKKGIQYFWPQVEGLKLVSKKGDKGRKEQIEKSAKDEANRYQFKRDDEKIQGFMDWLADMEKKIVLIGDQKVSMIDVKTKTRTVEAFIEPWVNKYIDSAYQKGIAFAREEARKAGIPIPDFSGQGEDPVNIAFNQPFHADRLGLLYTRMFGELKGFTADMDKEISRLLTQGIADGKNPRVIGVEIGKKMQSISRYRGVLIARTEIMRAHHVANLREYERIGLKKFKVRVEWVSAGDDGRTCDLCLGMSGNTYTLQEAMGKLPAHPRCRCVMVPVIDDSDLSQEELNWIDQ